MNAHPATAIFPMMAEAELSELAADIRDRGQQVPIVLHEGLILDGRNRFAACQRIGATAWTTEWGGEGGSPAAYVISLNLHRRHLTPGQRAAIAAESLHLFEAEAKERRHRDKERIPDPELGQARDHAAAAFNVNPRYVQDAKRLRDDAPAVFERVKAGEVSIPEARQFVFSEREEETPEEKAYYGLSRLRLVANHDPAAVADACADPELSLESFEALQHWLVRFNEALRARIATPLRAVK